MTLCYDNLVYGLQPFGGISTYWYELSRRLLELPELELHFYETGAELQNVCRRQLHIRQEQLIRSNRINLQLERFLKVPAYKGAHVFHSSYFRLPARKGNARIITTVHDCIHQLYFSGPRAWLHNHMKQQAIEASDLIITVSEHTKRDLLRFYPKLDADKVQVVYNGVSEVFRPLEEVVAPDRPYFLFLGLRDNYKNFDFAVDLVAEHQDFDLYVLGPKLSKAEGAKLEQKLPGRFKTFNSIEVSALNELYNAAFCLLYPSAYEGFGIPILEAMRCGCPFIALNRSAIPEVAGAAGVLLEAADMELARMAVRQIQDNRPQMIARGFDQAARFSWDHCFNQTHQLYKTLAG